MLVILKKKQSIYIYLLIVVFLSSGSLIFLNYQSYTPLILLFGVINSFLIFYGIEENSLKGRYNNRIFFQWLFYLLLSIMTIASLIFGIYMIYKSLRIPLNSIIFPTISVPILFTILVYFTLKFFNIIYKRLQDMNQPGYYIIGVIPIISWFIGVKIFKSGSKLLGVLVFLNLAIAILYILFVCGNKGSNYFGVNPGHIYIFKKEFKRINKAQSIGSVEKEKLKKELIEKYTEIEMNELQEFKKNEVIRLIKKEKLNIISESSVDQMRYDFYENLVLVKLERNYYKYKWC